MKRFNQIKMMINTRIYLLSMAFALLSGCSEEEGKRDNFDRALILTNVSANIVLPSYRDFKERIQDLEESVDAFLNAPSENSLAIARSSWTLAKLSWMNAEIFNFGPVDNLAVETGIDLWPTSTSGIESAIDAYNGSPDYLTGIGSNKKGLPAIEYLLFHDTGTKIATEFSNAEKRSAYLKLLVGQLGSDIEAVIDSWEASYQTQFDFNVGNDANSSITLLANEMIILVEKIKNYKIGGPLGITSGSDPLPAEVESRFAHLSLECISRNLNSIESVFTGNQGSGFDDYLDELNIEGMNGKSLSVQITDQIEKTRASLTAISLPLEEAIFDQQDEVEQLFINLQTLTVYMKTDMMSRLGLLVTFSDNDGD